MSACWLAVSFARHCKGRLVILQIESYMVYGASCIMCQSITGSSDASLLLYPALPWPFMVITFVLLVPIRLRCEMQTKFEPMSLAEPSLLPYLPRSVYWALVGVLNELILNKSTTASPEVSLFLQCSRPVTITGEWRSLSTILPFFDCHRQTGLAIQPWTMNYNWTLTKH